MPLKLSCSEVEILVEAALRGDEYKPFQVAKRALFEERGIAGTTLDRVFTAILYGFFRARGVVEKIVERSGALNHVNTERGAYLVRVYAYLRRVARSSRDSVLEAIARCLRELSARWGEDPSGLYRALELVDSVALEPKTREEELELRYLAPLYLIELIKPLLRSFDEIEAFLRTINEAPPLGFRVNTLKSCVSRVLEELRKLGVEAWASERVPNVVRYRGVVDYRRFGPLLRGEVVPQDEPSALAGLLLDPRPRELVLDMCAAPGGKTTHLAELARNRATVVAMDLYPDRMARLLELAKRTSTYTSIHPIMADARLAPCILGEERFDKVLLDPPCSSTGVLAKHPDARWRLSPDKILELVRLQRELLEAANAVLKPGGYLLYTTCSVTVPENEGNIRWFLHRHPCYELVPLRGPYDPSPLLEGAMRAWPHRHGVSGFFYALLRKRGRC
ncbi:MAG: RsmB/NOP family class I SAM-dependent RNA methyltransferase [Crenarchaeota archaeon]|nr:RsmB/NOP family class I SAM-dependent RNA methyltransferase [Thermoproteota archaeon]